MASHHDNLGGSKNATKCNPNRTQRGAAAGGFAALVLLAYALCWHYCIKLAIIQGGGLPP